jgi:hypothetical protein
MIPDTNDFLGLSSPPGLYVGPNPTYNNPSELSIELGGALIIGHSVSGFFPENAALVRTKDIRGMVSIEPIITHWRDSAKCFAPEIKSEILLRSSSGMPEPGHLQRQRLTEPTRSR